MLFDKMVKFSGNIKYNKMGKKDFHPKPSGWTQLTKSVGFGKHHGILTGKINDIFVVDLDRTHEEKLENVVDFHSLNWFEKNISKLSECNTLITKTMGGGYHIFFQYKNTNVIIGKKIKCAKIDILSDGSCCFQGENYDILYNNEIREMTGIEIEMIRQNMIVVEEKEQKIKEIKTMTRIQEKKTVECELWNVLDNLNESRYTDYDNWVQVAFCLKLELNGLDLFKRFSMKNKEKYNEQEVIDKWDSILNSVYNGKVKTIASLYEWLKEDNFEMFKLLSKKEDEKDMYLKYITESIDKKNTYEKDMIKTIVKDKCKELSIDLKPGCDMELIMGNTCEHLLETISGSSGTKVICKKCGINYPEIGHLSYGNHMGLNAYMNNVQFITINMNNTKNEDDDLLEVLEKEKFVEDPELNSLLIEMIDANNTENLLNLVKYYDRDNYICAGKVENRNIWYVWTNGMWKKEESPNMKSEYDKIKCVYMDISRKCKQAVIKRAIKSTKRDLGNMVTRRNVNEMWSVYFKDELFESKIDSNPYLVGFNNGFVYDLTQLKLRKQLKDDFVTMTTGYEFKGEGNGKRLEVMKFFEDIQPNKDDREFLLKTIASCLLGINQEERLGIHTGGTRNGKGVMTELLKYTFGDYMGTSVGSFIQGERPDSTSPQPDLINLRNKRIVIINEVDEKKGLNIQFVKNLVGNDTINTRALYSNINIEFKAQFTMFLCCNDRPIIESNRKDLWSKLFLLNYPIEFVDKNPGENQLLKDNTLKAKMKDWGMDMMLILIEYYKKYQIEGVEYTENINKFIQDENKDNDQYAEFIENNLERYEGGKIKVTAVLDKFNKFAKQMERKKYKEEFSKKFGKMTCKGSLHFWKDWRFRIENDDLDNEEL